MKPKMFLLAPCVLVISSCAVPHNGSQPYLGAGIGAALGAIAGQAIGKDTEGTLIGGAAGAIIGYLIAEHIVSRNNQIAGATQTRNTMPKRDGYPQALIIDEQSITPSQALQPGERATVRVQYKVLDDNKRFIPCREEKSIWHNGQLVQDIKPSEYTHEDGTYESIVDFTLPESAAKGNYEFRQRIMTDTVRKDIVVPFTVI